MNNTAPQQRQVIIRTLYSQPSCKNFRQSKSYYGRRHAAKKDTTPNQKGSVCFASSYINAVRARIVRLTISYVGTSRVQKITRIYGMNDEYSYTLFSLMSTRFFIFTYIFTSTITHTNLQHQVPQKKNGENKINRTIIRHTIVC